MLLLERTFVFGRGAGGSVNACVGYQASDAGWPARRHQPIRHQFRKSYQRE